MPYNEKTNTITFDKNSDLMGSMGVLYIFAMEELSALPTASTQIKNDWKTIKEELCLRHSPLSEIEKMKVSMAYQSYMARGVAPSRKLEDSFKMSKKLADDEKWQIIPISDKLIGVFDRLLATDKEILEKKTPHVLHLDGGQSTAPSIPNLSKKQRLVLSICLGWAAYVIFRTADYYTIFGIDLDRWDDDYFWQNLLAPFIVFGALAYACKWINSGK